MVSNHNCIQWVEVRPNPIKEKFNGIKCQGAMEFLRLCLNFGVKPTFAQVERRNVGKWKKSLENYEKKNETQKKKRTKQTKYLIRKYLQTVSLCLRGYESPSVGAERQ